jgi:AraC family transcriptional regulator
MKHANEVPAARSIVQVARATSAVFVIDENQSECERLDPLTVAASWPSRALPDLDGLTSRKGPRNSYRKQGVRTTRAAHNGLERRDAVESVAQYNGKPPSNSPEIAMIEPESILNAMVVAKQPQRPLPLDEEPLSAAHSDNDDERAVRAAYRDVTFGPITKSAGHRRGSEVLSKLISVAAATLESDRVTAKACIERAAELLSVASQGQPVQTAAAMRGGLAPWQRRNVTAYVAANIGSAIRMADLARVARLSIGHFFRAFRGSFGEPPLVYVTRQRIRHAQSVMLNSRAPLSQIALDCGMCDQSHFTRVFHRIVGINPGVWRRLSSTGDADMGLKRSASIAATHLTTAQTGSRHLRA